MPRVVINLRAWNSPMSALGQKQTYAVQKTMSALPPIATAKADIRKRSCLLYPQERTCAVQLQLGMSALGQKRTSRGFVAMSANDPNPTAAIAQSVVSRDALDVLRQQFAWRQITEV